MRIYRCVFRCAETKEKSNGEDFSFHHRRRLGGCTYARNIRRRSHLTKEGHSVTEEREKGWKRGKKKERKNERKRKTNHSIAHVWFVSRRPNGRQIRDQHNKIRYTNVSLLLSYSFTLFLIISLAFYSDCLFCKQQHQQQQQQL